MTRILSRYVGIQVAMLTFSAGFVAGCIYEAVLLVAWGVVK